jgi:hypothetical protein
MGLLQVNLPGGQTTVTLTDIPDPNGVNKGALEVSIQAGKQVQDWYVPEDPITQVNVRGGLGRDSVIVNTGLSLSVNLQQAGSVQFFNTNGSSSQQSQQSVQQSDLAFQTFFQSLFPNAPLIPLAV